MHQFRGDLQFTAEKEFRGKPYVPERPSAGIHLDIGVDLSSPNYEIISEYDRYLDSSQRVAITAARGLTGRNAKVYLMQSEVIRSISIPKEVAFRVFPLLAEPIWEGIVRRWPYIVDRNVPDEVHTAIFDLVYDRGIYNKHLRVVKFPLKRGEWKELAKVFKEMQSRHKNPDIPERRQSCAKLIKQVA